MGYVDRGLIKSSGSESREPTQAFRDPSVDRLCHHVSSSSQVSSDIGIPAPIALISQLFDTTDPVRPSPSAFLTMGGRRVRLNSEFGGCPPTPVRESTQNYSRASALIHRIGSAQR